MFKCMFDKTLGSVNFNYDIQLRDDARMLFMKGEEEILYSIMRSFPSPADVVDYFDCVKVAFYLWKYKL